MQNCRKIQQKSLTPKMRRASANTVSCSLKCLKGHLNQLNPNVRSQVDPPSFFNLAKMGSAGNHWNCSTLSCFSEIQPMDYPNSETCKRTEKTTEEHSPNILKQSVESILRKRGSVEFTGQTHSNVHSRNSGRNSSIPNLGRHFCVKHKFKNLKKFLEIIFRYEKTSKSDFDCLSLTEKSILLSILRRKGYSTSKHLKALPKFNFRTQIVWDKFYKIRRKEEQIKYSLRVVIKTMQARFEGQNPHLRRRFDAHQLKLLFYLSHFYQNKTQRPFRLLAAEIWNGSVELDESLWRAMDEYILPEMGTQSIHSKVKSISKAVLYKFSLSDGFNRELMNLLVDLATFLGYSAGHDWTNYSRLKHFSRSERTGFKILRTIICTNKNQLEKLFSEWNNKLAQEESNSDQIQDTLKVIKKTIHRKNFKFPWTFQEIQRAFVKLLLCYLEVVQQRHFLGSATCKSNWPSRSNLRLHVRAAPEEVLNRAQEKNVFVRGVRVEVCKRGTSASIFSGTNQLSLGGRLRKCPRLPRISQFK